MRVKVKIWILNTENHQVSEFSMMCGISCPSVSSGSILIPYSHIHSCLRELPGISVQVHCGAPVPTGKRTLSLTLINLPQTIPTWQQRANGPYESRNRGSNGGEKQWDQLSISGGKINGFEEYRKAVLEKKIERTSQREHIKAKRGRSQVVNVTRTELLLWWGVCGKNQGGRCLMGHAEVI